MFDLCMYIYIYLMYVCIYIYITYTPKNPQNGK